MYIVITITIIMNITEHFEHHVHHCHIDDDYDDAHRQLVAVDSQTARS